MVRSLRLFLFACMLLSGASGCALKETFNCLDRYCYLADWANHHSCVSCCKHDPDHQRRWMRQLALPPK